MASKTVNESLREISSELKETNLQYSKAVEQAKSILPITTANNAVLKTIGGSIKDNFEKSTSGFRSFFDQLESMPIVGAITGITKSLAGGLFSKFRQSQEDKRIAKQLGITKEEVAIRRKEQELLRTEEENNQKLLEAATALGYTAEQFEALTGAGAKLQATQQAVGQGRLTRGDNEEVTSLISKDLKELMKKDEDTSGDTIESGAAVEEEREQRRRDATLVAAVENVGEAVEGIEFEDDEESKGFLSGILGKVKNFIPMVLGGLKTLGIKVVTALLGLGGSLLRGLGRSLLRLGRGIGRGLTKLPGLIGKAGGAVARGASAVARGAAGVARGTAGVVAKGAGAAARAGGGLLRGAGGLLKGAAKFAGPVGLAVAGGMALFDGFSAGIEEFKKSGSIGKAVKEGFAGAVSGLTFGLVDQETISNGMSAIGGWFSKGWEGFTGFVGDAVSGIKDVAAGVKEKAGAAFNSLADGFTDLTGIQVPRSFSELKETAGAAFNSVADGFTNLTGIEVPRTWDELGTKAKDTFDAIGAGFTNLTGIEVPTFDDLQAKVSEFASNMKDKISEGWASITSTVGGWWESAKSMVGLGSNENTDNVSRRSELEQQISQAEDRISRSEGGENVYFGRETVGREEDAAAIEAAKKELDDLYLNEYLQGRNNPDVNPRALVAMESRLVARGVEIPPPTVLPTAAPETVVSGAQLNSANMSASDLSAQYRGMSASGGTAVTTANSNVTSITNANTSNVQNVSMRDYNSASQAVSHAGH